MKLVKGTLIPIGGNEDKGYTKDDYNIVDYIEEGILSHVVREAGGIDANIVVIPTASSIPVEVGQNYIEAFETFKNTPDEFDLVITDQTMPEMTGSELSRRILQVKSDAPIILCTGYSNLIDKDSAKALGIKEFALKPLSTSKIAELIRKVLDES